MNPSLTYLTALTSRFGGRPAVKNLMGGGYNGLIPNLFYFAASFGMAALSACPERVEALEAAV